MELWPAAVDIYEYMHGPRVRPRGETAPERVPHFPVSSFFFLSLSFSFFLFLPFVFLLFRQLFSNFCLLLGLVRFCSYFASYGKIWKNLGATSRADLSTPNIEQISFKALTEYGISFGFRVNRKNQKQTRLPVVSKTKGI